MELVARVQSLTARHRSVQELQRRWLVHMPTIALDSDEAARGALSGPIASDGCCLLPLLRWLLLLLWHVAVLMTSLTISFNNNDEQNKSDTLKVKWKMPLPHLPPLDNSKQLSNSTIDHRPSTSVHRPSTIEPYNGIAPQTPELWRDIQILFPIS